MTKSFGLTFLFPQQRQCIVPGLFPVWLLFCPEIAEAGRLEAAVFLSCTLLPSGAIQMRQKRKDIFSFLKFIQKHSHIQHLLLTLVSNARLDSGNIKIKQPTTPALKEHTVQWEEHIQKSIA